ncbi:MAG: hypothetical protein U0872_02660 [Planctomycetaceae bacterium]
MSFLSTLKMKFEKRVVDSRKSWRQLVAAVADGADADPSVAFELLESLGKTVGDLESEAEQLRKRREEAIIVVAGQQATAHLPKIRERIAAVNAELEAAEKRYEEQVRPLIAKRNELESSESLGRFALERLISSCTCPELIEERDELNRQMAELRQELAKVASEIDAKQATFSRRLQIRELGDAAAVERARQQVKTEIEALKIGMRPWGNSAKTSMMNSRRCSNAWRRQMPFNLGEPPR